MKSYYAIARAVLRCRVETTQWGDSIFYKESQEPIRDEYGRKKVVKYLTALEKLLDLAKAADQHRTCGTCLRWFHKSEANGKAWGRCTSDKANEAFYIMFRNIEDGMTAEQMFKAEKHMELRTEEHTFGCIHWEAVPGENKQEGERDATLVRL